MPSSHADSQTGLAEAFRAAGLDPADGSGYAVSPDGTITALVGPDWESARRRGELDPAGVPGRNLFDLILGDDVRAVYRRLHQQVSAAPGKVLTFSCHCDTPTARRLMSMTLVAVAGTGGGASPGVLYHSRIAETQGAAIAIMARLGAMAPSPDPARIVTMCSFCQRVAWPVGSRDEDRNWVAPETYDALGGPPDPLISHGLCPPCFDDAMRQIA